VAQPHILVGMTSKWAWKTAIGIICAQPGVEAVGKGFHGLKSGFVRRYCAYPHWPFFRPFSARLKCAVRHGVAAGEPRDCPRRWNTAVLLPKAWVVGFRRLEMSHRVRCNAGKTAP